MSTPIVRPPRARGRLGLRLPTRVSRARYAASALGLCLAKYAIDACIVYPATGALWSPLDYALPRAEHLAGLDALHLALLLLATLPFLWVGLSLSLRRARDAGLPLWTGLLCFAPVVNVGMAALLCTLPSHASAAQDVPRGERAPSIVGAAARAALLGLSLLILPLGSTLAEAALGRTLEWAGPLYGASLFVAIPFLMGFAAGGPIDRSASFTKRQALAAGQLALLLAGLGMLLFALEGALCLAMALPLAAPFAAIGSLVGRAVVRAQPAARALSTLLVLFLPLMLGADLARSDPPLREVRSWVDVSAAPDEVWEQVVAFRDLPPPREAIFALGIAYPVRADIDGAGVGAVRRCEFSTGAFVEPVTHWEPGRRLAFDVTAQPEPMVEWSPYARVYAPHLQGSLRSRHGEFRLLALPGGRTRLEGSTWYTLDLAPAGYWTLWSDAIIHAIHLRVLGSIERRAEEGAALRGPRAGARSPTAFRAGSGAAAPPGPTPDPGRP